jgi:hypothetical protein
MFTKQEIKIMYYALKEFRPWDAEDMEEEIGDLTTAGDLADRFKILHDENSD